MVVSVVSSYALLYSMCDLKDAQMNMQHSLIWKLYEFKLSQNDAEATKNICRAKGKHTVDYCN